MDTRESESSSLVLSPELSQLAFEVSKECWKESRLKGRRVNGIIDGMWRDDSARKEADDTGGA